MTALQVLHFRILQVGSAQGPQVDLSSSRAIDATAIDLVDDLPAAKQRLTATDNPPQLVVLFQARPGQFSQADIESLRALAPLARIWRVLGPWCEGETRSGHPPTGCTSLYWHEWPARLERELNAAQAGQLPEWSQPLTASSEERTVALAERPLPQARASSMGAVVVIVAPHAATAAALADVVRLGGYEPQVMSPRARESDAVARAVLWDAHADEVCDPQAVAMVKRIAPSAALIAQVTFPRPDDARRAAELGIAAIVAKPYQVGDLLLRIAQAVPTTAT